MSTDTRRFTVGGSDCGAAAGVSAAETPVAPRGSYDYARRRRTKRTGRETGCWLYIPGEELEKVGFTPGGPLPWYRVWGSKRGVAIRLYKEG